MDIHELRHLDLLVGIAATATASTQGCAEATRSASVK
jgi:hypothetical protein